MEELTLESRMKLHDIRDHMHHYAGRRQVKAMTRERLEAAFLRVVEMVQGQAPKGEVDEAVERLHATFQDFTGHDQLMEAAYDRIIGILLSSQDSDAMVALNLAEVVRDEVAYYHRDLRLLPAERVTFISHYEPWVLANEVRLRRLAGNLLKNAADALSEERDTDGVTVEVDVGSVLEAREGVGPDVDPGNYATLDFRDDGGGIPEDVAEHLFQPGYTSKKGHMGLGLTFVKQVVDEMNGRIEIVQLESGTLIRMYFPLVEPPEEIRSAGRTEDRAAAPT